MLKTLICASSLVVAGAAFGKTKKDAPPPQQPQTQHAKAKPADAGSVNMAPAIITKPGYPSSFVHRPLVLHDGMVQADSAIAISNYSSETGANMNLGLDVGVHPKVQAGVMLSLPL